MQSTPVVVEMIIIRSCRRGGGRDNRDVGGWGFLPLSHNGTLIFKTYTRSIHVILFVGVVK